MKAINESLVAKSLFVLSTAGALLVAPGRHAQTNLAGPIAACADDDVLSIAWSDLFRQSARIRELLLLGRRLQLVGLRCR